MKKLEVENRWTVTVKHGFYLDFGTYILYSVSYYSIYQIFLFANIIYKHNPINNGKTQATINADNAIL